MTLRMWKLYFNKHKQLLINTLLIQFIMKKIFFVAIAASLLAAGCQKTEIINQVNPVGEPSMAFNPEMGKLTKAGPSAESTGMENLKEQDFKLWAYFVKADSSRNAAANSVYDHMENILVSDTDNRWGTKIQHFWPGTGKALKFFAVSGFDNATINNDRTVLTVDNFTVAHANPDTDLMVADYVEAHQASHNKNVPLHFRHALSKVEFLFANSEAGNNNEATEVYVQGMYVSGINTVGDLTATVTEGETEGTFTTNMAWTSLDDPQTFVGDYKAQQADGTLPSISEEAANKSDYKATITNGGHMHLSKTYQKYTTWLVIPQDVKKAATEATDGTEGTPAIDLKVTIQYVIGTRQFVSTFSLGGEVNAWAKNQYIKYNVNLTPNMIGFAPSVEDWTPVNRPNEGEQGDKGVNDPSNDGKDVNINN